MQKPGHKGGIQPLTVEMRTRDARNQGHKGEIQPLKAETRAREGEQTLLKTEM
jgi:hypothetical protein